MRQLIKIFIVYIFCSCGGNDEIHIALIADLHFDPPPMTDQYEMVEAINNFPGKIGRELDFVISLGDLTDKADSSAFDLFRQCYEYENSVKALKYPLYIGLGNHDVDPHVEKLKNRYFRKQMMLDYLKQRHFQSSSPVSVNNFDEISLAYSWDFKGIHFVQVHMFVGNTSINSSSCLEWLKTDLKENASDKPVILCQHVGFDDWALNWWSEQCRADLNKLLKQYNVLAIFAGHSHVYLETEWNGIPVYQVNNAWEETGKGNNDGKASFVYLSISSDYKCKVENCYVVSGE
jgi:cytolysin (calcineurin-like family phosphatase)